MKSFYHSVEHDLSYTSTKQFSHRIDNAKDIVVVVLAVPAAGTTMPLSLHPHFREHQWPNCSILF
jgi:hypothetical protein